jgi:hypothetical protein
MTISNCVINRNIINKWFDSFLGANGLGFSVFHFLPYIQSAVALGLNPRQLNFIAVRASD